jgi:hypothetical protein
MKLAWRCQHIFFQGDFTSLYAPAALTGRPAHGTNPKKEPKSDERRVLPKGVE